MNHSNDIQKLRVLLPHWIDHNMEHAAEFRAWARKSGEAENDLLSAADQLVKANRDLEAALKRLGGSPEANVTS